MNLFALGEESAQQLGVETERFKTVLIVTGSLLTAVTVAFAGIIGFVGLMVPHMARRLAGRRITGGCCRWQHWAGRC